MRFILPMKQTKRLPVCPFAILIILGTLLLLPNAANAGIQQLDAIKFTGKIVEPMDISAIAAFDNFLIVGADEGIELQVLARTDKLTYKARERIELLDSKKEIDLEGIARQDNTFYIVGSHSWKRKTIKPDATYQKNRKRLATIKSEASKNYLFRLQLDRETGKLSSNLDKISLSKILLEDKVLKHFTRIPSKENGIDIEAIGVDEKDNIYLGFRGPVLRSNYVPVMVTTFKNPEDYELRYVNLGGRGIRAMTEVKDGFLLVGGPVGDGFGTYQLYFWDGSDSIPGKDKQTTPAIMLGEIPTPEGAKAEGITLIKETNSSYQVIVVYDSAELGAPTLLNVVK